MAWGGEAKVWHFNVNCDRASSAPDMCAKPGAGRLRGTGPGGRAPARRRLFPRAVDSRCVWDSARGVETCEC